MSARGMRRPAALGAMAAALAAAGLLACGSPPAAERDDPDTRGSLAEGGWTVLFDGTDLRHWRGYRRDDVPAGWQVQDGLLAFVPGVEAGDLITREQYGDFELELDWRVSPGGNSGIFYRAGEDTEFIWEQAPEMQVLDDARHTDGDNPLTSAGSNYALHAPAGDAVRPAGEWNQARIVARGSVIEHWLNGQKVVEYELGSPDWEDRVARSKFSEMPGYGRRDRGHIGLQDHGDRVWFRNIRVRVPPAGEAAGGAGDG